MHLTLEYGWEISQSRPVSHNQLNPVQVVESMAAFDLDGEGLLPVGQLMHILCTEADGGGKHFNIAGFIDLLQASRRRHFCRPSSSCCFGRWIRRTAASGWTLTSRLRGSGTRTQTEQTR